KFRISSRNGMRRFIPHPPVSAQGGLRRAAWSAGAETARRAGRRSRRAAPLRWPGAPRRRSGSTGARRNPSARGSCSRLGLRLHKVSFRPAPHPYPAILGCFVPATVIIFVDDLLDQLYGDIELPRSPFAVEIIDVFRDRTLFPLVLQGSPKS